jgi:hypothetical protein
MLKLSIGASLVAAFILAPLAADGQQANRWRFRQFQVDNDLFHYPYSHVGDRFYTSGILISFGKGVFNAGRDDAVLPVWLRPVRKRCSRCVIYPNFSVGQQMYTPEDIENPLPQPGERPWSAWVIARYRRADGTSDRSRHEIECQIGLTGDAAGGECGQECWHAATGSLLPLGWDNQLGPELGVSA